MNVNINLNRNKNINMNKVIYMNMPTNEFVVNVKMGFNIYQSITIARCDDTIVFLVAIIIIDRFCHLTASLEFCFLRIWQGLNRSSSFTTLVTVTTTITTSSTATTITT